MIGLLWLVIAILIVPPGLALIYVWVHRDDPATIEERGDLLLAEARAAMRAWSDFCKENPSYKTPTARQVLEEPWD
jgi:hypothetical protein